MSNDFTGKVCVVTGAGSGIGRALALQLATEGAILAISDIDEAGLEETNNLIGNQSNRIRRDVLDVADKDALFDYAQTIQESLGAADCLFNVAGLSRFGSFSDSSIEAFEKVMEVNFWGVVRLTKAFLPQIIETKGRIVNISSLFGLIGVPDQAHYCASKFGVRGFSESIAIELEDKGVSVISVHPGGVATNIARNAKLDMLPDGVMDRRTLETNFDNVARTTPARAAEIILDGTAQRKRRVLIGMDAKTISFVQRLFPKSYGFVVKKLMKAGLKQS